MATEHFQSSASEDSAVLANNILSLQTNLLKDKIQKAGIAQGDSDAAEALTLNSLCPQVLPVRFSDFQSYVENSASYTSCNSSE